MDPTTPRAEDARSLTRRALSVAAYPTFTGGAVVFALFALGRGWAAWMVGVVVIAVASVGVELLERVIPYRAAWARPRGDRLTDALHFVFSSRAFDLGAFLAVVSMAPLGRVVSARLGTDLWPHHAPLALQVVAVIVMVELPMYWIHRLEHRWAPLWRVHAVHHSSRRMYWWNFARNHPLDNLLTALGATAPLAVLGVGEAPLTLVAAFTAAHAILQHSNADLRTGFLDVLFSTARVHRFHHSRRREEADANYGPTLTLYDWVFGSRRFSADVAPPEDVGLGEADARFPTGFVGQLGAPFDEGLFTEAARRDELSGA
jgi:sterol desaturase/sphingolipid hydroxylase (fatty acid hydroxylase superfamily)